MVKKIDATVYDGIFIYICVLAVCTAGPNRFNYWLPRLDHWPVKTKKCKKLQKKSNARNLRKIFVRIRERF